MLTLISNNNCNFMTFCEKNDLRGNYKGTPKILNHKNVQCYHNKVNDDHLNYIKINTEW